MVRKLSLLGGVLTALAAATPGAAQEGTDAYWAEAVDSRLASQLFPRFAALLETPGWARVRCWVRTDGHPYLCDVVDEAPRGLGFGAAARVIVASAQVGVSRVDGRPVPTTVQTTIRFNGPATRRGWDGPAPSVEALALARELLESKPDEFPPDYRTMMMDGLDFDRRQVVGPWIDELLPMDHERTLRGRALQVARLFSEEDLRRIRAGEPVEAPSPQAFDAACPEPTPEEALAIAELRRRYCDRYDCAVTDVTFAGS